MSTYDDETLTEAVTAALLASPSIGGDPFSMLLERGVSKSVAIPESGKEMAVRDTARRAAIVAIGAVRRWEKSKGLTTAEVDRLLGL